MLPLSLLGAKVAAANTVGALARRAGRGGGTSLPGKVLMRLQPDAIARLGALLPEGSAVISATNGKTTTAAMAASILRVAGRSVVHNETGANMAGGVASTLAGAVRGGGRRLNGRLGLFEVDEFWLPGVCDALHPRAILLGNLFRDQLDRYGELDSIADRWAALVADAPAQTQLVLCADDPLIADLGRVPDAPADEHGDPPLRPGTLLFGIQDTSLAQAELPHASDSKFCRRCGAAYTYDAVLLGHLGHFRCPVCGAGRPTPHVQAHDVELDGVLGARFRLSTPDGEAQVSLPLPGLYNVYNALGAAALCLALGVALEHVVAGLAAVKPAFGRAETIEVGGRPTSLLLIKNPAGANEIVRTLVGHGHRRTDTAAAVADAPGTPAADLDILGILNDRVADGRDVSWVWDADLDLLVPRVRVMTCSGTRAAELAVRMKYAGLAPERIRVEEELAAGLDAALADGDGPLHVLPTYTAMLDLRDLLTRRGDIVGNWR